MSYNQYLQSLKLNDNKFIQGSKRNNDDNNKLETYKQVELVQGDLCRMNYCFEILEIHQMQQHMESEKPLDMSSKNNYSLS